MFRRKEETVNDPMNPAASGSTQNGMSSHTESLPLEEPASAPVSSASATSAQSASYVPTGSTARTPSEPSRSAIPAMPAGSYRPTPIAEFNRGAMRSPVDAPRASAATNPTSSFGGNVDKSASGKSNRRVLTVGNDILLKGEIATCDRLVIEGRVEAKLSDVHTVEIADAGSFKGTAEVEDAEVSGVFEGDLIVRNRLVIYASGEVRGNISYGEIEIERGGKLTGQIKTVNAGAAKGKNPFEPEKARAGAKETAAA